MAIFYKRTTSRHWVVIFVRVIMDVEILFDVVLGHGAAVPVSHWAM